MHKPGPGVKLGSTYQRGYRPKGGEMRVEIGDETDTELALGARGQQKSSCPMSEQCLSSGG